MRKVMVGALVGLGVAAVAWAGVAVFRPDVLSRLGLARPAARPDDGLFCRDHGVPEKFCTLCHPELKEKLLLCPEHGGIPEEICTRCHPENAARYDIKPCPHGSPAHFCGRCHAENFPGGAGGGVGGQPAAGANLIDDGWCAAFGMKGLEGRGAACKLLPVVRLASAGLAGEVGLKTALVVEEEHAHELGANAETAYDANRYAEIHPRVRGYVREARVDLGRTVRAGEVVAVVDSAEVSTAKTQYLAATASLKLADDTHRRISSLVASDTIARKEEIATRTAFNQAKAGVLDAEQRLRNFRFDDPALRSIVQVEDTRSLLDIITPIDGTVIRRHAVLGEAVEPTADLFTVADTGRLWIWVDVFERDLARVREGQPVAFDVAGTAAEGDRAAPAGRVTWVGSEVDEKTRTTKVRAEIPNPGGKLRAHQYGRARIRVEGPHQAIIVAKAAVQRYEDVDLVFLAGPGAIYRPQRVKVRPTDRREVVEVSWGLRAGQEVVTEGSFLLKTEIMKGSIGAGCCD